MNTELTGKLTYQPPELEFVGTIETLTRGSGGTPASGDAAAASGV